MQSERFRAAAECLPEIEFEIFHDEKSMKKEDEERNKTLVEKKCDLIILCESWAGQEWGALHYGGRYE